MNRLHEEAMQFVENRFSMFPSTVSSDSYPFRDKLAHTKRVVHRVRRISSSEGGDRDKLVLAAILHDVGYTISGHDHPTHSAEIARLFLMDNDVEKQYSEDVCTLIRNHGDRSLLHTPPPHRTNYPYRGR